MKLIQGIYESQEATQILSELVDVKIKFHENKIHQSQNEEDIKMRERRIKELQAYLQELRQHLATTTGPISMDADVKFNEYLTTQKDFTLIDGVFDSVEAEQILLNAFESKIKFHSLAAFGKEERGEAGVEKHYQRIEELKKEANALKEFLKQTQLSQKKIAVNCSIAINIQDTNSGEFVSEQKVSYSY